MRKLKDHTGMLKCYSSEIQIHFLVGFLYVWNRVSLGRPSWPQMDSNAPSSASLLLGKLSCFGYCRHTLTNLCVLASLSAKCGHPRTRITKGIDITTQTLSACERRTWISSLHQGHQAILLFK